MISEFQSDFLVIWRIKVRSNCFKLQGSVLGSGNIFILRKDVLAFLNPQLPYVRKDIFSTQSKEKWPLSELSPHPYVLTYYTYGLLAMEYMEFVITYSTAPQWKIAKMALLNPCMKFKKSFGQKHSFEALSNGNKNFFS